MSLRALGEEWKAGCKSHSLSQHLGSIFFWLCCIISHIESSIAGSHGAFEKDAPVEAAGEAEFEAAGEANKKYRQVEAASEAG